MICNEQHLTGALDFRDWARFPRERVVCDLIASMTDRYALDCFAQTFFPSPQV